jgi:hypothetical protein
MNHKFKHKGFLQCHNFYTQNEKVDLWSFLRPGSGSGDRTGSGSRRPDPDPQLKLSSLEVFLESVRSVEKIDRGAE